MQDRHQQIKELKEKQEVSDIHRFSKVDPLNNNVVIFANIKGAHKNYKELKN